MKRLAANGVTKIVHEGHTIEANGDVLEVPDHLEHVARSHGAGDLPKADEPKVIERVVEVEKRVEVPVEKPDLTDPNSDGATNIDEMKRGELCASLKALGVSYKLPISNDELRAMLKDELVKRAKPPAQEPPPKVQQSTQQSSDQQSAGGGQQGQGGGASS